MRWPVIARSAMVTPEVRNPAPPRRIIHRFCRIVLPISSRSTAIRCSWLTASLLQPRSVRLRVEAGAPWAWPAGGAVVGGGSPTWVTESDPLQLSPFQIHTLQPGAAEIDPPQPGTAKVAA